MSNLTRALTLLALTVIPIACGGGGGGDSGGSGGSPTQPSGSSPLTPASVDPTADDWAQIGAQLAAMGAEALQAALTTSGSSSGRGIGPFDATTFDVPSRNLSVSVGHFCCGRSSSSTQSSTVRTTADIAVQGSGPGRAATVALRFEVQGARWSGASGYWTATGNNLEMTAPLASVNGKVDGTQTFRLAGALQYALASGSVRSGNIDVRLNYANFVSQPPAATGAVGSYQATGGPLAPQIAASRCSLPREGCGPLAAGNAPCTPWPPCA
jgi:hypothetical protein